MCRIEERTGNRPVLPVCQSPYTPAYLVLCDRGERKSPGRLLPFRLQFPEAGKLRQQPSQPL